jgi:hypothetical protein
MNNYIVLLGVIVAVVLLGWFVSAFSDWNKQQACATAGLRNCGVSRTYLSH